MRRIGPYDLARESLTGLYPCLVLPYPGILGIGVGRHAPCPLIS
jgi:hypothetical protein